ncbi:hypothetical protein [Paludibacterium paludis]|uniref:Uncharacterized protein n=1 Tax=Paludibacterium paludis TaxID=1225769 RepID=A0A918UAL5_9NEIS|nr:hypothetical protein [Paludibacterium paludis]GGY22943.1 hypothetical protein GCM10011289_28350 [Paludibacterium paludis]
MNKKILLTFLSMVFSGSVALASEAARADDAQAVPQSSARIRLFGQNGVGVWFYRNMACYKTGMWGPTDAETVSGGLGDAFASFVGVASNSGIGMPETTTTREIAKRNGMLSKAFFREYSVDADKPLTVLVSFGDVSGMRCGYLSASFVPKAGKDYEGVLNISVAERVCRLEIKEITGTPEATELKLVDDMKPAGKCR